MFTTATIRRARSSVLLRTLLSPRYSYSSNSSNMMASSSSQKIQQKNTKKQVMELTEAAAERIKDLLGTNEKPYLKIGIRTRGCNGMTYTMNYADEKDRGKFDEIVEQHGVKVIIEPNALMTIIGTKMDFVSDNLRSEFTFENPNAKASCGCGESFST
jgi:iron-sulfur cluster assembly 1